MTAVTVRLMDRALKPEMTPLYQIHAQKAPLGAFRNKNVTFGKKSQVFKAKNNGHPKFTPSLGIPTPPLIYDKQHQDIAVKIFLRL